MEKELIDLNLVDNEGAGVVYEASYLLLPTLSQEQVPGKVSAIKEALVSLGAKLISDEDPVLIDLNYEMTKVVQTLRHKADQGYFGWVKFELEAGAIENVKKIFDNNVDVLRHLIIKTVRENTLLNGKMKLKSEDKGKRGDEMLDESGEVLKEEGPVEDVEKVVDDLVVA